MQSRMEKYYKNDTSMERSAKNKKLYNEVYEEDFYTELGTIENESEVDISKIKEMMKSREDYQRAKQYRELLGDKIKPIEKQEEVREGKEEPIYDIHSIIEKAKEHKKQEDYRKITNPEYDVLGKLDIAQLEKQAQELLEKNRKEEEELKELIHTISSKTLAKEAKEAFALELLSDLKETGTHTAVTVKEEPQPEEEEEMDKSFFTTSAIFDKNDFEDIQGGQEGRKIDSWLVRILIFLVIVIIIVLVIFLVKTLL